MDYKEFSRQIKEKYPYYKNYDDGFVVKSILEKHPYYRDLVDISSMDSDYNKKVEQMVGYPKNEPVVQKTAADQIREFIRPGVEAAFPRLTQHTTGEITPSEVGKDVLRGVLDVASFAPRFATSIPKTARESIVDAYNTNPKESYMSSLGNILLNIPSKFVENLGVTETPKGTGALGFVEDVARGPFIAVPGVGQIAPKTASLIPKLAGVVGDVALGAGVGAGMGTAESVAANKGVNPLGVGIGSVLGSIGPLGRGVKGFSEQLSDNAFTAKFVKEMQEQALNGNSNAQLFLNDFAQTPTSETVRKEISNKLAAASLFDEQFKVGKRAYNEARRLAESQGLSRQEADVIARKSEDEAINAYNLARNPTTSSPEIVQSLSLDPNKTIKHAAEQYLGYEAPNIPRALVDDQVVKNSIKGASDITGLPSGAAFGALFTGVGSPYFAVDLLRKNPHALADATQYIPKQFPFGATVARNLGATLLDGSTQENRRYNQK